MGTSTAHTVRRGTAVVFLAALLLALPAPPARAYLPDLDELYARVSQLRAPLQRAVMETRTVVYDPLERFARTTVPRHPDLTPPEVPARAFRQKIWWMRDGFLGIETYADDGTPLHVYLHEGVQAVQGDLTATRSFSEADVVPPYLAFASSDPARWRQAVTFWGLAPRRVELARGVKGRSYYRLAEDETRALWLEPALLRPVRLETRLVGPQEGQLLTLEFSEFILIGNSDNDAENFSFPRTTNVLLDGQLIKQTVLVRFDADTPAQRFPIARLRALAARAQQAASVAPSSEPQGGSAQ
jgi:hypothetical protein